MRQGHGSAHHGARLVTPRTPPLAGGPAPRSRPVPRPRPAPETPPSGPAPSRLVPRPGSGDGGWAEVLRCLRSQPYRRAAVSRSPTGSPHARRRGPRPPVSLVPAGPGAADAQGSGGGASAALRVRPRVGVGFSPGLLRLGRVPASRWRSDGHPSPPSRPRAVLEGQPGSGRASRFPDGVPASVLVHQPAWLCA